MTFNRVSRAIRNLGPSQEGGRVTIPPRICVSFDLVADTARDCRLGTVGVSLSAIFWEVIGTAFLILALAVSSNIERTQLPLHHPELPDGLLGTFAKATTVRPDQLAKGDPPSIQAPSCRRLPSWRTARAQAPAPWDADISTTPRRPAGPSRRRAAPSLLPTLRDAPSWCSSGEVFGRR